MLDYGVAVQKSRELTDFRAAENFFDHDAI